MNSVDVTRLEGFLRQWTRTHPLWQHRAAEDIAAELAADVDFGTIRLAGWLQSPDGALIAQTVQHVLPYPYNYGADLLADAVKIAAAQRTERQRGLTLVGGIGLAGLVMFLLSKS
jgi:hypothetical protein